MEGWEKERVIWVRVIYVKCGIVSTFYFVLNGSRKIDILNQFFLFFFHPPVLPLLTSLCLYDNKSTPVC
jgi:hypothetical protein